MSHEQSLVLPLHQVRMSDVQLVGGKNASLGEMINHLMPIGVRVPEGIAVTAEGYRFFVEHNQLKSSIDDLLNELDVGDLSSLKRVGSAIRSLMTQASMPDELADTIKQSLKSLNHDGHSFAVRSSATTEDLPQASFAGQQETFLNVSAIDAILDSVKAVFASLFNDRAISYRHHQGFSQKDLAISVGIQRMIRSDLAASGVLFTLDTESGFSEVVFITSSYGLGEAIVQGQVNPDEFYVSKHSLSLHKFPIIKKILGSKSEKMIYASNGTMTTTQMSAVEPSHRDRFSLSDEEVVQLADLSLKIERHYQRPMDIEWAKDGRDGQLYILQARPETVASQINHSRVQTYHLEGSAPLLLEGRSIGKRIGSGAVRQVLTPHQMEYFQPGEVLVADMTDPDWEPVMKQASAIVTNRGGRTCHAAIIARELGIPAVVGCGHATKTLNDGQDVTVSCAEGDVGKVYQGILSVRCEEKEVDQVPSLPVRIMMNIANPEKVFSHCQLPSSGIGLARLEFIISNMVGIHPSAALDYSSLPQELKDEIAIKTRGYDSPENYYVERIAQSIAMMAAAFYPKPVILRMSDFKSNEYAHLLGGHLYEPTEENPMMGFRGAARYLSPQFARCFDLECRAVKRVRQEMGFDNLQLMIPFVRTLREAADIEALLTAKGLQRGQSGLKIVMMCEIPSNVLLAEAFLGHFDGFSIGSNDLTQLTLGVDRDSELVADSFNEQDPAVKQLLAQVIATCKKMNKYVGICGQGPSDYLDFADWLLEQGIDSISLNPDTVMATTLSLAR